MKIQIVTPAKIGTTLGNRITAERWESIFSELGHETLVTCDLDEGWRADLLIALHATKSFPAIQEWKSICERPLIVCLTGTDLHCDLLGESDEGYRKAVKSLQQADQIILLESEGVKAIADNELRDEVLAKSTVVYQSGGEASVVNKVHNGSFEMTLVGHLRPVKDPFLVVKSLVKLPGQSRISVTHIGSALNSEMEQKALELTDAVDRYHWIGPREHQETLNRMAASEITLLTSRVEGAPGVISEAIVNRVPVIASRIPATIGTLGDDYPGLFEVGDSDEMARIMWRSETESEFRNELLRHIKKLGERFSRSTELNSWKSILESI